VLEGPIVLWLCVAVAQGGIGYLQYFTGVPAALVAAHVAGATLLWAVTVWLVESLSVSVTPGEIAPDPVFRTVSSPVL
jgi:cytochrome c oxidase assembly protein subunit 15